MAIFGLNFNPFKSAQGGEVDQSTGKLTQRGKTDFFASPFDFSNSISNWKSALSGDISWKDFIDPGSVINNPAQKIADPGEFFTGNKLTEGEFGKRGRASAILAALLYGGGAMAGAGGGEAGGEVGAAAAGGEAGAGGTAGLSPVAQQPWYKNLFNNQNFLDVMQGGGDSLQGGGSMQEGVDPVVQGGGASQTYLKILAKLLKGNKDEELEGDIPKKSALADMSMLRSLNPFTQDN